MKRRLSRAKRKIKDAGIPLPRPGRPPAAGAAGGGARGRLPDLQRGLRRPRRPGRGGAPARRGAGRADAGRARGARAARADAAQRRAPRGPVRRTASSCCSPTRTARAGTRAQIARGREALDRAFALRGRGQYVIQAAIASLHMEEPRDWPQIAALYGELVRLTGSAVVELNRAIAVAEADGDGGGARPRRPARARRLPVLPLDARRPAAPPRPERRGARRVRARARARAHRARAPLPAAAHRGIQRLQLDEQGLTRRALTLAVPSGRGSFVALTNTT